jgi:hypothetical protein
MITVPVQGFLPLRTEATQTITIQSLHAFAHHGEYCPSGTPPLFTQLVADGSQQFRGRGVTGFAMDSTVDPQLWRRRIRGLPSSVLMNGLRAAVGTLWRLTEYEACTAVHRSREHFFVGTTVEGILLHDVTSR